MTNIWIFGIKFFSGIQIPFFLIDRIFFRIFCLFLQVLFLDYQSILIFYLYILIIDFYIILSTTFGSIMIFTPIFYFPIPCYHTIPYNYLIIILSISIISHSYFHISTPSNFFSIQSFLNHSP